MEIEKFKKTGRIEKYGKKLCLSDPEFKKCDKKNLKKIKWEKIGIKDAFDLKKSLEENGIYSHKNSGIDVCLTDNFKNCIDFQENFVVSKKKLNILVIILIIFICIMIFIIF